MTTRRSFFNGFSSSIFPGGTILVRVAAAAFLAIAASTAIAQQPLTPAERRCVASLQGKVAWDQQGDRTWDKVNMSDLCRGTSNPEATIACFQSAIQAGQSWDSAIPSCRGGAPSSQSTNVQAVTKVSFGWGGNKIGEYQNTQPGHWVETHVDGTAPFQFDEVRREPGAIYLLDGSRGVNIELDLVAHKVDYSDTNSPNPRILYNIRAVSPPLTASDPLADPRPTSAPSGAAQSPAAAVTGSGQIDSSFAVLRCGAVNDPTDAVNKCSAVCQNYQGFSGSWAVAAQPNLAVCQCNAKIDTAISATEIITPLIKTNDDAAQMCPAACQYYGGGDGTWRPRTASTSLCGCVQPLH